jgi:hypothetical protein
VWQVQCCAAAAVPRHCERAGDLLGLRPLLLLGLRLLALAAGEPERAGDLQAEAWHARDQCYTRPITKQALSTQYVYSALHTRSIAQHPSHQESRSPTHLDGERAGLLLRLLSLPRLLLLLRLLERLGV